MDVKIREALLRVARHEFAELVVEAAWGIGAYDLRDALTQGYVANRDDDEGPFDAGRRALRMEQLAGLLVTAAPVAAPEGERRALARLTMSERPLRERKALAVVRASTSADVQREFAEWAAHCVFARLRARDDDAALRRFGVSPLMASLYCLPAALWEVPAVRLARVLLALRGQGRAPPRT